MKRSTIFGVLVIVAGNAAAAVPQLSTARLDTFRKYVTRLPPVDRVDVIELRPVLTDELKSMDCKKPGSVCAPDTFPYEIGSKRTLIRAEARAVTSLWRSLQEDFSQNNSGCLNPDYLLRFFKAEKLILESQICVLCHTISLPELGVVSVEGSRTKPYYDLQELLLPDATLEKRWLSFSGKMMPKVGQEITLVGLIANGKAALTIEYEDWLIELDGVELPQVNELDNLGCHTAVKVTGVLQHYTPPITPPVGVQMPPDHFYFYRPQIEVMRVEQPRKIRRRHQRL